MATYPDSYRLNGEYPTDFDNGSSIWDLAYDSLARVFSASASYTAHGVSLPCTRGGTPGTINVDIYAVDINDKPTGSSLASGTFDGDAVDTGTTITWPVITFSVPLSVNSGTKYAIVMTDASPDGANAINWWREYDPVGEEKSWSTSDGGSTWDLLGTVPSPDALGFGVFTNDALSPINPGDKKYTRNIVTFSNNKVFYGPSPDSLVELTAAAGDIDCSEPLQATEAYGKVFVANHDKFRIADFINSKLTTADIGANIPYHGDIIRGGSSNAAMVVDYIDATSGATIIYGNRISTETFTAAETVTGTNKLGNAVSFVTTVEVAGPFWYAWTPYGNDTTAFGTMPTYASITELHIGKMWLSGDAEYPHQWYATRQNNPFDFLYAQNDAGSAVAGNNTDAGEVGDIVIDMISYSDDYLIYGCSGSLYVMQGNPCAGGRLTLLRTSGLLASRAWCWDNDGNMYILCEEGLLRIAKGFADMDNITKESYPDFINDIAYDPSIHRMTMAYDPKGKGIIISRVLITDGTNSCWFYDMRTGGLFPEQYPEEGSFFSLWNFEADDPTDRGLLIGSQDGFIRKWDRTSKSDDAGAAGEEAINSYIGFGPMPTANGVRRYGRIGNINVVTGGDGDGGTNDSDTLYCKVYTEPSAQKLIKQMTSGATPRYQRNLKTPGFKKGNVDRRKVRGRWVGMVIGNNTVAQSFAFENITANNI